MGPKEIAAKVGIPLPTAYYWIRRGREELAFSNGETGLLPPGCSKDAARPG